MSGNAAESRAQWGEGRPAPVDLAVTITLTAEEKAGIRTPWLKAADTVLHFGKYKGKSLRAIGGTERGLLYLDWLLGEKQEQRAKVGGVNATWLEVQLVAFLTDVRVAAAVTAAVNRKGGRQ